MQALRTQEIQTSDPPPRNSGGRSASATAQMVTKGVYTFAKRVTKFSTCVFFSVAVSTISRILETVESS